MFKVLRDAYFLSKCSAQVKHVVPANAGFAETFCMVTRELLLAMKSKGANHADAVSMVCVHILDNPETFVGAHDPGFERSQSLQLARNYCRSFSERWPNDPYIPLMRGVLLSFQDYSRRPDTFTFI